MKNISPLLYVAVILLSSCQKNDEYLNDDSQKALLKSTYLQNKPNGEVRNCQILQISYTVGSANDILQINYNGAGDPVSVTRTMGARTGYPNFVFKYDDKNRLSELIAPYNNTTAEYWHKYFYDNQGDIILDSAYVFPGIANGFPENAFSKQLTYYTYDNKSRIIKDSTVFSSSAPVVHTYSYDDNGNKIGYSYDDKVNLNRTNKIWMFLNRDYSVNNPFNAGSYNATGLPTDINLTETSISFLGTPINKSQVNYQCK